MRCEEIMKRDPECLSPDDSVQSAARQMRDQNIGFLPVCDPGKRVVGTVTDRDLAIRVLADAKSTDTAVDEILTREMVACHPEDDLKVAQQLMARHHKSRIMCVDDGGHLIGIISLSDIAQHAGDVSAKTLRDVSDREARF